MKEPTLAARMPPAEVFHPSEFIAEEMAERGWTRYDLWRHMRGDAEDMLALDMYFEVGPTAPGMLLGEDMAAKLGRAFGMSAQFFLNLETVWRAAHAKH